MTIKTSAELAAVLADNEELNITPADLRDIVDSVTAIGGTLHGTDVTEDITAAWAPFAAFDSSIDTKGITEDLVAGTFTIGAGADGVYAVDASICVESPAAGRIDVSLTRNGVATPYRAVIEVSANQTSQFVVQGTGNLAAGDEIGLAWKGSGSTTLTVPACQLRAIRI